MIKRLICLLSVLVLCFSCAVAEEEKPVMQRYEFDLTFSVNPESFPARSRSRARGYAQLLDRLELRGDILICDSTQSFDLNATLFFSDKPEVSIPFRFYGTPSLLFLTSPIFGNETLLFNMIGLAEFAIKIKKSLDTPLPALALLYPVVYQHNLWNIWDTWEEYTGPSDVSREISAKQISDLADAWTELLGSDTVLNIWITALTSVSSAPEAVEAELNAVPSYLKEFVSAGEPLTVEIGDGTEVWQNASGMTLFAKETTDHSEIWSFTLPADENRYTPTLEFSSREADGRISFHLDGSMIRGKMVLPEGISEEDFSPVTGDEEDYDVPFPLTGSEDDSESESDSEPAGETGSESEDGSEEEEYDVPVSESGEENEESYEDEDSSAWPKTMFILSASGDSIPTALPCDSSFSLAASMQGALYPNFDVVVRGNTKKDGSVSVSFGIPQEGSDPSMLLSCQGSILRNDVGVETVPDYNYSPDKLYGTYNFFSFSEYYVAKFKDAVTKPLIKGLLDFVAEAPTAACQSFLDDLTDSGILNMMMADQ